MRTFRSVSEVISWLKSSIAQFGFHLNGENTPSLGEDLAQDIAIAIRERGYTEGRGAGGPWPQNSDEYLRWKETHYHTDLTNFRTMDGAGSMMSTESLTGTPAVTPHEVQMQYGLDRTVSGSESGYTCEDDFRRTDRQKAEYAHSGVQGDRSFYELSDETNEPVGIRVARRLKEHLEDRLAEG